MPITESQSSFFILKISESLFIPALFTSISILPNFSIHDSITLFASSGFDTSAFTTNALLPTASIFLAVSDALVTFSVITRSAPSSASAMAIDFPIPFAAPVTTAIFPFRVIKIIFCH